MRSMRAWNLQSLACSRLASIFVRWLLGLDSFTLRPCAARARVTEDRPRAKDRAQRGIWLLGLDSNQQPSG